MEGLILFNKPKGITSYKVVEFFKKLTDKKVGHGGTLDPFAEGLLILGVAQYTKDLTPFLKESRKTYIAEIELGKISSTYDIEGEIKKVSQKFPSQEEIKEVLKFFEGEIYQKPPIFSALKIKGKPAYKLARKNIKIEFSERKVKIYSLEIIDYQPPFLKISAEVGSGTYIRSLANDIGEKLKIGGYLKSLLRTKINEFSLDSALTFEDLKKDYLEFIAKIYGRVQKAGFRFFTEKWAQKLDVKGYVRNLIDGSVEVLAQGKEKNLQELIEKLKKGPILAKVEKINIIFRRPIRNFVNFQIET